MSRIQVVAPKVYSNAVIDTLYQLGALHIKSYTKGELENLDNGTPLATAEELSQVLLALRSLKEVLQVKGSVDETKNKISLRTLQRLKKKVDEQLRTAMELTAKVKNGEQECAQLRDKLAVLEALGKWGISPDKLVGLRHSAYFLGTVKDADALRQKLSKAVKGYELKRAWHGDGSLVFILVQKSDERAAQAAVQEGGLSSIALDGYFGLTAVNVRDRLKRSEQALAAATKARENMRVEQADFILEHEFALQEEIKKAEVPLQFATTAQSLIATGYVPTKQLGIVKKKLTSVTKGSIHIEEEHIHHDELVPVKLHNAKTVKNFEVLTRLYELPSYFEFDPSSLLFVTFPLFFGIMLGDVGYGVATLLLFLFLKKKFSDGKALFNVLIYASIVTIAFGFVFGEYLGYEHIGMEKGKQLCEAGICFNKEIIEEHGERTIVYSFPRLLSRMEGRVNLLGFELYSVLVLGIVVGAIHLNIGFLIGFYNVWKQHGVKLAILEKLSWIVLEVGLAGVVLSLLGLIILQWWVGAAVALAGVVMLCFGEGVRGIIEILGLVTNMLSYMRLGAVGLASVGLAVVINEHLAQPFFEKGGVYVLIAIIVMVIGHAINLALGIIGPFLHGIRLHYVECFSKFFHGGGIQYNPFGVKNDN